MSRPYPLFRMLGRPAVGVFVAIMAVPLAVITFMPVAPGKDLASEVAAGVAQVGMVALAGFGAAALGMAWGLARIDLHRSALDWNLPGLRRWLLAEDLVAGLMVALLSAWILVATYSHGSLSARLLVGIAMALACFAGGGLVSDLTVGHAVRLTAMFGIYGLSYLAEPVERALLAYPAASTLICASVATALWLRRGARRIARRRPHDGLASAAIGQPGAESAGYWQQHGGPRTEWARPLTSNRLLPWLHASAYESVAGAFWGPLGFLALIGLLVAVVVHYFSSGYFALFNIGMVVWAFAVFPFRLRSGLAYPLSRPQRARLVATGALLQESALILSTLAFLALLKLTPLADLWRLRMPGEVIDWPVMLLVVFAWIPIVSWGSVQAAAGDWRMGRNPLAAGLVPLLAYLAAAALTLGSFGEWWREGEWALVVVLVAIIAVGTRAALWWATHRLFARADLSLPAVVG